MYNLANKLQAKLKLCIKPVKYLEFVDDTYLMPAKRQIFNTEKQNLKNLLKEQKCDHKKKWKVDFFMRIMPSYTSFLFIFNKHLHIMDTSNLMWNFLLSF